MSQRERYIQRLNEFIDILQRDGVIRIGEFDHWWPDQHYCWLFRHKDEEGCGLSGWGFDVANVKDLMFDMCDPDLPWKIIVQPKPKQGNILASSQSHVRKVEL